MSKKISVIMGIYNCADTLEEAVNSIIAQTYTNWELIMCDDGSADDTYAVAKRLAEKEPRIILIRNEQNMKLSKTLNHCLKYATGEYIARMDGDDISLPERFEKQVEFLENNPKYIVCSCAMIPFDENGEYTKRVHSNNEDVKTVRSGFHAPLLCRREMYDRLGGYCEKWYANRCEDVFMWHMLSTHEDMFVYNMEESYYKVRENRNTYSRRNFKNAFTTFVGLLHCYKMMKYPLWKYIGALRPFVPGILPYGIMKRYHDAKDKHDELKRNNG